MSDQARLLLIDDDPGTLQTYREILKIAGYEIAAASSGDEALALLKSNDDFRLVLSDLRLTAVSGLEVLAEVSTNQPELPVVMISAWWTDASELASKRLGAVALLDKPLDARDLVESVRRNVRGNQAPWKSSSTGRTSLINHAAIRWGTLIVPVTRLKADPKTVAEWGESIGKAPATLKAWCAAAGVHAGDSLDCARLLRVVISHTGRQCDWYSALSIIDSRTLARLLKRGGLSKDRTVPDPETFLANQQLVVVPALVSVLRAMLEPPARF